MIFIILIIVIICIGSAYILWTQPIREHVTGHPDNEAYEGDTADYTCTVNDTVIREITSDGNNIINIDNDKNMKIKFENNKFKYDGTPTWTKPADSTTKFKCVCNDADQDLNLVGDKCVCKAGYTPELNRLAGTPKSCEKCKAGTYKLDAGDVACTSCEAGTASNIEGRGDITLALNTRSKCPDCPTGTYQPGPGKTVCRNPRPGYYAVGLKQTGESPCDKGTFAHKKIQRSSCTECPMGTYNDQDAQGNVNILTPEWKDVCTNCAVDTYNLRTGMKNATDCKKFCTVSDITHGDWDFVDTSSKTKDTNNTYKWSAQSNYSTETAAPNGKKANQIVQDDTIKYICKNPTNADGYNLFKNDAGTFVTVLPADNVGTCGDQGHNVTVGDLSCKKNCKVIIDTNKGENISPALKEDTASNKYVKHNEQIKYECTGETILMKDDGSDWKKVSGGKKTTTYTCNNGTPISMPNTYKCAQPCTLENIDHGRWTYTDPTTAQYVVACGSSAPGCTTTNLSLNYGVKDITLTCDDGYFIKDSPSNTLTTKTKTFSMCDAGKIGKGYSCEAGCMLPPTMVERDKHADGPRYKILDKNNTDVLKLYGTYPPLDLFKEQIRNGDKVEFECTGSKLVNEYGELVPEDDGPSGSTTNTHTITCGTGWNTVDEATTEVFPNYTCDANCPPIVTNDNADTLDITSNDVGRNYTIECAGGKYALFANDKYLDGGASTVTGGNATIRAICKQGTYYSRPVPPGGAVPMYKNIFDDTKELTSGTVALTPSNAPPTFSCKPIWTYAVNTHNVQYNPEIADANYNFKVASSANNVPWHSKKPFSGNIEYEPPPLA